MFYSKCLAVKLLNLPTDHLKHTVFKILEVLQYK